ncbi:ABC transporter substrate-binding protein [Variovorax sp. J22P271]|uniref:ABC transporter substrate-binding protein n=1 Tax=Variovorax davisae TaxID=3053515 RepID=UPI002578BE52|nr:ABC transporter substrate-binding protein [Variovorax sp. J22P271]MDM0031778.1 ABC transporter substrate-binding protein [Variovorax sp. J22P271]
MNEKYLLELIEQARVLRPRTPAGRREFIRACAAAGIAPTLLLGAASKSLAAAKEIVVANWGGDSTKAMKAAFGSPYAKATGSAVVFDVGPLEGKIKAMVDNQRTVWDAMAIDAFSAISLGKQGYLRAIDYAIVGRDQLPGTASEFGVPAYLVSHVLTYDARRFGKNPPRAWSDFWDVEKFPGKRALWKWMGGALEAALMADGVAKDQVFPMDVPRALRRLEALKSHVILWDSGAESQQMVRQREVSMASIWHSRATLLRKETAGAIDFTWHEGVAANDAWSVPKGNPAGDDVWRFLAFVQTVEPQLVLLRQLGVGPTTHQATTASPEDIRQSNPGSPENMAVQCKVDTRWWADNYQATLRQYSALFAG